MHCFFVKFTHEIEGAERIGRHHGMHKCEERERGCLMLRMTGATDWRNGVC